jgi:hypothetical protein
MIVVKVTYTVKPEFVPKNQENISLFMADFRKMDRHNFRYNVYLKADGRTFVHLSHFKDEIIQNEILNVPSFKSFQKERDESGLNNSHQLETFKVVDASADIF